MANVVNSNPVASNGFNPIRAINTLFAELSESFEKSRKFQATYRELDSLSQRELADLGIARSDVTRIAYDAVYGDGTGDYRR